MYRTKHITSVSNAKHLNEGPDSDDDLDGYLAALSNSKPSQKKETIGIPRLGGISKFSSAYNAKYSEALNGTSFIKKNTYDSVSIHSSKINRQICESDGDNSKSAIETARSGNAALRNRPQSSYSTSQTTMTFHHLSSTPKRGLKENFVSKSGRQDEISATNPHYSDSFMSSTSTRMKSSTPQPAPSKPTEHDSTSTDENAIRSFDDLISIMGDGLQDENRSGSATSDDRENDRSQSASPTLTSSSDSSTRRNASPVSFTYDNRSECRDVDDYSDDFESGDEEGKCENRTLSEATKKPDAIRPRNRTPPAKEATSRVSSDASQASSSPTPLQFVSDEADSTSGELAAGQPKAFVLRKAEDVVEKTQFRNAGTLTDTSLWSAVAPVPWQHPSIQAGWYDQSAFVAAVTAAVEQITARQSGPRPLLEGMLESRSVVDTVTSYNPCVTVLDNMLRQQLQLTREFLATHRAMHDTLMAALQKCVVPPLRPMDLRLNYTSQPMKPL